MTWSTSRNPDRNPARKCVVLGMKCDSQLEGKRWLELSMMEKAGKIRNLRHHERYPLVVVGMKVCTYESDADYVENGMHVTEDTKGRRSGPAWSLFRLKAKLFRALHGYDISVWPPEIKKPRKKSFGT